MQGGEEAGDLGLEEPDSLAEDGRPVLFRLEGLLRRSQLLGLVGGVMGELRLSLSLSMSPSRAAGCL